MEQNRPKQTDQQATNAALAALAAAGLHAGGRVLPAAYTVLPYSFLPGGVLCGHMFQQVARLAVQQRANLLNSSP